MDFEICSLIASDGSVCILQRKLATALDFPGIDPSTILLKLYPENSKVRVGWFCGAHKTVLVLMDNKSQLYNAFVVREYK